GDLTGPIDVTQLLVLPEPRLEVSTPAGRLTVEARRLPATVCLASGLEGGAVGPHPLLPQGRPDPRHLHSAVEIIATLSLPDKEDATLLTLVLDVEGPQDARVPRGFVTKYWTALREAWEEAGPGAAGAFGPEAGSAADLSAEVHGVPDGSLARAGMPHF